MSNNNQFNDPKVQILFHLLGTQNYYVSYGKYGIDRNSFICPLCGSKHLISEAVHHSVETNREFFFDHDQVTYHNFRICRECEANIQKGNIYTFLLTACLIFLFYVIFTYFYFYAENTFANHILGNINERNGFVFCLIVVGVIFVSPILWMFCRHLCEPWYKDFGSSIFRIVPLEFLSEAYEKNAIAPMDEKDQ